jgi:hypothetical protein
MKLLFLHGAPAAGKLTVAKAVLGLVPGRLFDNHAALDPALTLFEFGAPGFWELVHNIRREVFAAAAEQAIPLVVTTFCYAEPSDRAQFEKFDEIARRRGGELLPVFLYCSRAEAARRVGNPDRIERRKMTSPESLSRYLDDNKFAPVPRADVLKLNTEAMLPAATAQQIVSHFGLHAAQHS